MISLLTPGGRQPMTHGLRRSALAMLAAVLAWLPAAGARPIDIKEVTTPLGIKAWLVEDKSAPVVALSFSFAGGTASDPDGQSGVTSLMATLLTDGAGPLDAQAFRRRQEDAAASLGFGASLDRLSGTLRVLSANRDEGFELLRLALTQPRFDPDMVDQRRAQTIAGLNQAEQRPQSVAGRTLMTTLFAGHPYANNPEGTREDLKTLTPAAAQAARRDAAGAQRPDRVGGRRHRRGRTRPPARPRLRRPRRSAWCRRCRRNGSRRPSRAPSSSSGRCRKAPR